MGLFGLWAIGRVAMLLQARLGALAAVLYSLFLVVFAAVIWREVLTGRNWRNLPVCAIVTGFAAANVGLHLRAQHPDLASVCERLALGAPAMLIAVIGGRVVPSFTRNWFAQRKAAATPAPRGWFDQAVLATTGLALAVWIAFPESRAAGVLLVAAGPANLARLARWRGLATGREALVWVLHAGYAWLGAALLLLGLSILVPSVVPSSSGVHALTVGAFGVMTLAMMTRASLGHMGRPRTADRKTLLIYLAVNAAALVRVLAPMLANLQPVLLGASAALWCLAFVGFASAYGPMLLSPRVGT
jgi:uncharacterized protein involved in response to NO